MRSRVVFGILPATICGCSLLLSASQARALVIPPRIAQLAETSELIVLAKVESVGAPWDYRDRRAKATVMEVWKVPKVDTVEYLVSPSTMCDISCAERGEIVLLFLEKNNKRDWCIAWSGRGRMPLRNIDSRAYLAHFSDVIFPADTPSVPSPEKREDGFAEAVELQIVRGLVRKAIDQKK